MNTYSFPIRFADRLNVPEEFPRTFKVVAENLRQAQERFTRAMARHSAVSNPNYFGIGLLRDDDGERQAQYLADRGITVEEGDTTEYPGREIKQVWDQGYLSDIDTDVDSAIKYIQEAKDDILEDYPEATDFQISVDSEYDSTGVEFKMNFRRPETQAESDLRAIVERFEGAARKREKLRQLEALKRELGEAGDA